MPFPSKVEVDELRRTWTDRYVRFREPVTPNWQRFAKKVGRVITVNYSGRAIVDFADGGWYDVARFAELLEMVTDETEIKKYDATKNSAQKIPEKQG